MAFLMMLYVILLSYADDTTLYTKFDQISKCDLWQKLELASELELDL